MEFAHISQLPINRVQPISVQPIRKRGRSLEQMGCG
ncbi:hypothetical protein T09_3852 [Trichinella sp. T9]|nr:hypothetical protein T09_3852 [Trichinella sp. T9]